MFPEDKIKDIRYAMSTRMFLMIAGVFLIINTVTSTFPYGMRWITVANMVTEYMENNPSASAGSKAAAGEGTVVSESTAAGGESVAAGASDVSAISAVSEAPTVSEGSVISEVPSVSEASAASEAASVSGASAASEAAAASEASAASGAAAASEGTAISEGSATSEMTTVSGASAASEASTASEASALSGSSTTSTSSVTESAPADLNAADAEVDMAALVADMEAVGITTGNLRVVGVANLVMAILRTAAAILCVIFCNRVDKSKLLLIVSAALMGCEVLFAIIMLLNKSLSIGTLLYSLLIAGFLLYGAIRMRKISAADPERVLLVSAAKRSPAASQPSPKVNKSIRERAMMSANVTDSPSESDDEASDQDSSSESSNNTPE